MTEDATLSEFGVNATTDEGNEGDGESAHTDADTTDETERGDVDESVADADEDVADREHAIESPNPNSSLSTYAWSGDEYECRRCGATSDRVWRDGGTFVCPDCKGW